MTKLYYFDQQGWLTETPIENRSTTVEPPADQLPNGYAWNFLGVPGREWVMLETNPAPVEVHVVPQVPAKVTRRQARQALLLAGKLAMVEPAINAIPDATQRALIMIEWQDSLEFERNRPSLVALATAIGMTSADLDALFVQAAKL